MVLLRRERCAQALAVSDCACEWKPFLARCPALATDVIAERRDLRTADGVGESRRIARRDGGTMIRNGPYTVYLLHDVPFRKKTGVVCDRIRATPVLEPSVL
jgi:hypothetical protein